ncbi:MAG: OmpA family protein [Gammaproteobacteria bacterium]
MMKTQTGKPVTGCATALSAFLLAGSLMLPPAVRATEEYSPGYQYDMRGEVVRDAAGNCLRTAQWSPENALAMCDPNVVAQRSSDKPVIGKEARVTGVAAQVDLAVLQAGDDFAFDKAELSGAGKEVLSQIVTRHKNQYVARVFVAGYTDRIGNDDYNLKLSQRRADAVKVQLIADGIPADRIHTSAEGSADPLVSCPGLGGETLIRCLAPNRRTEVRFVIPVVSTATLGEFVGSRRQEKIEEKNVEAAGIAVNTPIIQRGMEQAVKIMGDGCSKEVNSLCEQVPLGGGQVMNCLFDHESQLSSGCKQAIDKGESTIEAALGDANFFGANCAADMQRLCPGVVAGGGRLLACLMDNINNTELRCYDAMLKVGLFHE